MFGASSELASVMEFGFYRSKCGDALRLGVKVSVIHSICGRTCGWHVKLCDASLSCAIPERFVLSRLSDSARLNGLMAVTIILMTESLQRLVRYSVGDVGSRLSTAVIEVVNHAL